MTLPVSVVVWDQQEDPRPTSKAVLCWQSYAQGESISSVPRYLEEHAERLRQKYLAFIHDLGQRRIAGKRVVDHLDFGDGFSFWWMTQLAEKSPLKSPRIYDCLRLIALEEILLQKRPSQLTLVSSDKALARAIRRLCDNLGISFQSQLGGVSKQGWSLRRLYDALPSPLKGLLSLRHVAIRWPLRGSRTGSWFSGDAAIFICSYFIHLDPMLCGQGQFHSRQWEVLPKSLHEGGRRINWVELFLFSSEVPNIATGRAWLRQFNQDADNQGRHTFLDGYLTLRRVLDALKSWLRLNTISWRLSDIQSAFYPSRSAVWLWPMLRDDWQSSLTGPVAVSNCLWVELFDAALADMPRQKTGLYLCENQSWEKALLRAWRKYNHGEIIGVQHATAPFWHLYYFDDPRCLTSTGTCGLPLPDRLAVNGAVAWNDFAGAGYPVARLVAVEALRYLHLAESAEQREANSQRRDRRKWGGSESRQVSVLILGELVPASVDHLLRLLEESVKRLPSGFKFTFKPHPSHTVNLADYPGIGADETRDALGSILGDYDVAVAANSTSASVEAYVAGLPVIIGLNGDDLNLSPLRGRPGACFVSTSEELVRALQMAARVGAVGAADREDFFFLDSELPRWKRLLGYGGRS